MCVIVYARVGKKMGIGNEILFFFFSTISLFLKYRFCSLFSENGNFIIYRICIKILKILVNAQWIWRAS